MIKRKTLVFVLFVLSAAGWWGCSTQRIFYSAPVMLPYITQDMYTAGFWVNLHPAPDETTLDPDGIRELNATITENLKLRQDIAKIGTYFSYKRMLRDFENSLNLFSNRALLLKDGSVPGRKMAGVIKKNMNWNVLFPDNIYKFALAVKYTEVRALPTDEGLYFTEENFDIDHLQVNALDVGTILAISHVTEDGAWFYGTSAVSSGWVKASEVVICSREDVGAFENKKPFVIVTGRKAELFLNPEMTQYYDFVRMGARLPLFEDEGAGPVAVIVPYKDKEGGLSFGRAFISRESVHKGYLPYTPRVIIQQAFKLLNMPYSGGGKYGGFDSSDFIMRVFACVGIYLPKNPVSQEIVGKSLARFNETAGLEEKYTVLKQKVAVGPSLLHIEDQAMLYLGIVDNRPYAIHALFGYAETEKEREVLKLVKRVVVTDLSIGKSSKKGALLKRVYSIREIK